MPSPNTSILIMVEKREEEGRFINGFTNFKNFTSYSHRFSNGNGRVMLSQLAQGITRTKAPTPEGYLANLCELCEINETVICLGLDMLTRNNK